MLKMLLPVDGSQSSLRAVDFAVRTKDWYRDPVEIHLINVQPPLPFGSRVSSLISHHTVEEYHREEGMKALEPAMHRLDGTGIKYVHHISIGDAAEIIVLFAKEKACDQIVMGTRGLGTTSSLLLGSVSTRVIDLSEIPVLLVK